MFIEIIKTYPAILVTSFILDAIIGDPKWLPHPVKLIGRLISFLENKLNTNSNNNIAKILCGVLNVLIVLGLTGGAGVVLLLVSFRINFWAGILVEIIMSTYCLAARDLIKHAMNIYNCRNDIIAARKAVGMIVGRDVSNLSEHGVIKATIESISESLSDGVIAPAFFIIFFGPVGGLMYKAINTMDSMIGYHNQKYEYYGKPAAIADDIVNYIPSRLSALCIIAAAFIIKNCTPGSVSFTPNPDTAFRIWRRDGRKHLSPNSAQTESAMAGALGLRLGGSAVYFGNIVEKPYIGDDTERESEWGDIKRAGTLMYVSALLFVLFAAVCGGFISSRYFPAI